MNKHGGDGCLVTVSACHFPASGCSNETAVRAAREAAQALSGALARPSLDELRLTRSVDAKDGTSRRARGTAELRSRVRGARPPGPWCRAVGVIDGRIGVTG